MRRRVPDNSEYTGVFCAQDESRATLASGVALLRPAPWSAHPAQAMREISITLIATLQQLRVENARGLCNYGFLQLYFSYAGG